MVEEELVPYPPPISLGTAKRVNSGPSQQEDVATKKPRLEPMLALVEAIEANKILLQFAEESRKSLEDTKTKLKEFETREEALKAKLTTVESYAKALQ
ncbi:hypothetical protein JHK87_004326 [Glycine soja]|nr:hypothetical protein JHK87_004326 [Glycine soja]KAG5080427.1 hypothetical protein JHK86_004492 [Glycine max]